MEEHPMTDLVDRLQYKADLVDSTVSELLRECSAEILRLRNALESAIATASVRTVELELLNKRLACG